MWFLFVIKTSLSSKKWIDGSWGIPLTSGFGYPNPVLEQRETAVSCGKTNLPEKE